MNYREEFNKALNILCIGEASYVETDFLRETFNKLMDEADHLEYDNRVLESGRKKTAEYISKLQDENKELREEFNILSSEYEKVSRKLRDVKYSLAKSEESLNKLQDDNMKLSEQLDNRGREDSLSIEELKTITFCVDHFQLIFPNLFHKLTSMIEIHDVPTPKEMTVEEIERVLGHSIKVVK